jgi:hypothetical protein
MDHLHCDVKRDIAHDVAPYLLTLANRNDPICVVSPKVAKASTMVTVACRCRWHNRRRYRS